MARSSVRRKAAAAAEGSQVNGRDMRFAWLLGAAQANGAKERLGIDERQGLVEEEALGFDS